MEDKLEDHAERRSELKSIKVEHLTDVAKAKMHIPWTIEVLCQKYINLNSILK